ncbi:cytochrome P450 [Nocardia yamanashiensis]|uniref:cytochrome P450 n=1 Tax=Nocardia yamanashiensis TaxID=209247 RepID=UPI001E4BD113|nr:cytochrome P450 [Nocardia yamanashiensis]UGT39970.1 cytochrome P450 [Nocardia yamanashiensis]
MTLETPATGCPIDHRGIRRITTAMGHQGWLVSDYQQVRKLFSDPNLGRAHPAPETAARVAESTFFGGPMGDFATEHAEHERMRGILQPFFAPAKMRAFRGRVEEIAAGLFDTMAANGSPADLYAAVALPLPLLVICELLGVPEPERGDLHRWTDAMATATDALKAATAAGEMLGYCTTLVARKRTDPADDVISRLCERDDLTDSGAALLAMLMLFAGHETSVVQIGMGALHLLRDRAQWQALVDRPELVAGAAEELLRVPDAVGLPRYARADFEVDGVGIGAGELVVLDLTAANHDAAVFTDPDRIDIARKEAAHLTFGYGVRYCVGAPLARIELQVVYTQLVSRFPTMRLAVDPATVRMREDVFTGGVAELPVAW